METLLTLKQRKHVRHPMESRSALAKDKQWLEVTTQTPWKKIKLIVLTSTLKALTQQSKQRQSSPVGRAVNGAGFACLIGQTAL